MRNKIEEEEKREEVKKTRTGVSDEIISDREIVKTRTNNNFAFPKKWMSLILLRCLNIVIKIF